MRSEEEILEEIGQLRAEIKKAKNQNEESKLTRRIVQLKAQLYDVRFWQGARRGVEHEWKRKK